MNSITCSGYNNGEIDLIVSSNGSLTYSWTGPNLFTSNMQDISSLIAGSLSCDTDQNGCIC